MRILHLVHNHPMLHPGGTEIFAHELFRAIRTEAGVEQMFLAAVDDLHRRPHPGTRFQTAGEGADEILLWAGHFDRFQLNQTDTEGTLFELGELAETFRPDIVHFHHLLRFGANALPFLRRVCPDARFVLSLHDYYPLCHRDGVLLRNPGNERCEGASPTACNGCFPEISPARFRVRDLMLKAHLSGFDRFVAPSAFLRDRYVDWGLPADRIDIIGNGRALPPAVSTRILAKGDRRNRFAVLGNLSVYKGTPVVLAAARQLADLDVDFSLDIHGAALYQTEAFVTRLDEDVRALGSRVRVHGAYRPHDVPAILATADWVVVPSIWWENAPLVIDEAFHHHRPVLCGGIGGMAERVQDGTNGLHFRPADPLALADAMRRAATEPGLWEQLSSSIRPVRDIADAAREHLALYRDLRGIAAPGLEVAPQPVRRRRAAARAAESFSPAQA